jgi:hypothetical protein
MADEFSDSPNTETEVIPLAEPKRQRAPRRSKDAIAAALAAKKSKTARKPRDTSAGDTLKAANKVPADRTSAKSAQQKAAKVTLAMDEFADLIALEAENQKLRRSLAEKLRAENADLRKKLGLA